MTEDKKTSLFTLFKCFFEIGAFTFGGGMAMLPILERECVEKHAWATEEEMLNYFAIGQCTPGILAVNTATFIGCKKRGVIGGIVATLGIISPGFIIILILASFLKNFADNPMVIKAFEGIRISVVAIILNAVIKLGKKAIQGVGTCAVLILAMLLQILFGISPILIVISSIILGIIIWRLEK